MEEGTRPTENSLQRLHNHLQGGECVVGRERDKDE